MSGSGPVAWLPLQRRHGTAHKSHQRGRIAVSLYAALSRHCRIRGVSAEAMRESMFEELRLKDERQ